MISNQDEYWFAYRKRIIFPDSGAVLLLGKLWLLVVTVLDIDDNVTQAGEGRGAVILQKKGSEK